MGVTGLWSLVEPAGKPVPLESLENKILAVDVSIWLNQAVKGFRDKSGNAVPNAHILGLFHRICKLLFYRIRPIFVFDGQAPLLKKETLRRRRMKATKAGKQSMMASAKILDNYIRSQAVACQLQRQSLAIGKVLERGQEGLAEALNQRSKQQEKDLFELPPLPKDESALDARLSDSDEDEAREEIMTRFNLKDIHQLDVDSKEFKRLPKDVQYEILTELKDRRKQNSWGKMAEMPKKAENFSGFQMERLIKRRQMQKTLEDVGKELGQENASALDTHLFVGDVAGLKKAKAEAKKIDSSTSGKHYIYITGLKNRQLREMRGEENPDSPDTDEDYEEMGDESEMMARHLALSGEMSQDEILELIRRQKLSGSFQNLDDDDSDEDLLEPSTQNRTSNRIGGGFDRDVDPSKPGPSKMRTPTSQSTKSVDSSSDDDDDFVDVNSPSTAKKCPDAVTFGQKTENVDDENSSSEDDFVDVNDSSSVNKSLTSKVEADESSSDNDFISDRDEKSDDTNSPDDLFGDIFKSEENTSKLDEILKLSTNASASTSTENATPTTVVDKKSSSEVVSISLADITKGLSKEEDDFFADVFEKKEDSAPDTVDSPFGNLHRFETTEDIFAHITQHARRKMPSAAKVTKTKTSTLEQLEKSQQSNAMKEPRDIAHGSESASTSREEDCAQPLSDREDEKEYFREQIADTMKKSDHLWLKIASKWAVDDVAPKKAVTKPTVSNTIKKKTTNSSSDLPDFEAESAKLIQEMRSNEKEDRLLRIKNLDLKPNKIAEPLKTLSGRSKKNDEAMLANLGVKMLDQTSYEQTVARMEGLEGHQTRDQIFESPTLEVDLPVVPSPVRSANNEKIEIGNLGVEQKTARLERLESRKTSTAQTFDRSTSGMDELMGSSKNKMLPDKIEVEIPTQKVSRLEGMEVQQSGNQAYGSSAPGFVRPVSERSKIIEVAGKNPEPEESSGFNQLFPEIQSAVNKLDDDTALLSKEELVALQNSLAREQQSLIAERSNQERMAATISDQMYSDCQELLQLFGLPWIVSPSEAEAQCAFLDMNGLSHGTITDDSDVWVFGGQKVYKNFFNQAKYCEQFMAADLAKHFGLSREKMILLAELTGSDYTDGIESVGPVTALEILADFPGSGIDPLLQFKTWWEKHQRDYTLPPGSKLREKLVRLRLPQDFPSENVFMAYLNPAVDNSTEKFTWAVPNLVAVRDYAADKFGWPWLKIDEMLKPVIKKLSTKVTQERIDNFFMSERFALPEKGNYQSSRRVKQAIDKVLGKVPEKPTREQKARSSPVKRKQKDESHETSPRKRKPRTESDSEIQAENEAIPTIQPAKDWKKEEEFQRNEAKRKAAEILSKSKSKTSAADPESEDDFEEATVAKPFPSVPNPDAEKSKPTAKPVAGPSTSKNKSEEKKEIAEDDPGKAWKREEALKREEARKRAVALMKKNWKSQHLSLGLTRNDLKPPASRVTGANNQRSVPRERSAISASAAPTNNTPGTSGLGTLVNRAARQHLEGQPQDAGATSQPLRDRKTEDAARKEAAKQKAIEIFKKSQAKRARKAAKLGPSRIVLPKHELSESESD